MELANKLKLKNVRLAVTGDEWEIAKLLRNGRYLHAHPDWYEPVDWIGERGFVVLPEEVAAGVIKRPLFGTSPRLQACLIVAADPAPAAWVRVMAVRGDGDAGEIGERLWAKVRGNTVVSEIGWLLSDEWPLPFLQRWGFSPAYDIETYRKDNVKIPSIRPTPSIRILPAKKEDMAALAKIETAVFDPLWRNSAKAMKIALPQTFSFNVAWAGKRLIGYQMSNRAGMGAHIARITVAADWHGRGIGSALMAQATRDFQQAGLYWITLNAQLDNNASLGLYAKFGFRKTAVRYPIWRSR